MRSFANKGGRSDQIFGGRTFILALPLAPERYRYSKGRESVCLQNCKRYLHFPSSSATAHSPSQLEDENLQFQEELTLNVRRFDENEKKTESLLDVLDEVGISLELRNFCSAKIKALRDWENIPREEMAQWVKDMEKPPIGDEAMVV
jgi:hypothetical protein